MDYRCPFCNIVTGGEDERTIVWRDQRIVAALALHQQEANHGALLLFPVNHYENIYSIPIELGLPIFEATKALALALKDALACDGITIRQNNEPAGDQDVWHYHVHLIPRYTGDDQSATAKVMMPIDQRVGYAAKIRDAILHPQG